LFIVDFSLHFPQILIPDVYTKPTFTADIQNILKTNDQFALDHAIDLVVKELAIVSDDKPSHCLVNDAINMAHVYEPFTAYFAACASGTRVIGFGEKCNNEGVFNAQNHNANCEGITPPVTELAALPWKFADLHYAFNQCFGNRLKVSINNNQYTALASLASSVGCKHNDKNILTALGIMQEIQIFSTRATTEVTLFLVEKQNPCVSQQPYFKPVEITPAPIDKTSSSSSSSTEDEDDFSSSPVPAVSSSPSSTNPVINNLPKTYNEEFVSSSPESSKLSKTTIVAFVCCGLVVLMLIVFGCVRLQKCRASKTQRKQELLHRLSTADGTIVSSYGYVL